MTDAVTLLPTCICGSPDATALKVHRIPVLQCARCGVIRAHVEMTREDLAAWYREHYYGDGIYQHTLDHDAEVAEVRLARYHLPEGIKLLDVGAGNGAFVTAAREAGLDAWGQDLAEQSDGPYIFVGALDEVAFPTDDFDVVTVHDVLEHMPEPVAMLHEIRRVLKPGGKLIIDFPRFHHENGKHHWKPIEHLWYLDVEQLIALLRQEGFIVQDWDFPLPSKVVIQAESPLERRPQLLVPAGIGDAYWVVAKLRGFLRAQAPTLKREGLNDMPDVWVQDQGGPRRTEPFLRTIPFVHAAGYRLAGHDQIFREAYMRNGRTVFPKVHEVDWFIAYNGVLRHGRKLEEVDPEFGCEWYPRMHISKEARAFQEAQAARSPYAVCFFASSGMYQNWIAQFGPERIWESLVRLNVELGLHIVMMGAKWDYGSIGDMTARRNDEWTNLTGQTSYDQMLGLVRGASLIFGWPAGNTLLGPVFHVPTLLVWHRYFHEGFWRNCVPPDAPYQALHTDGLQPDAVVAAARNVMALAPVPV